MVSKKRVSILDRLFDTLKTVNAESVRRMRATDGCDSCDKASSDLKVLSNNPPVCTLFITTHTGGVVPKTGDLLVGFYTDEPTKLTMTIGGHSVCEHNMQKGEFVFADDGCFVVPMMVLQFHEVIVESSSTQPVYCIFAFLQNQEKVKIHFSKVHYTLNDNSHMYYSGGMCSGRTTVYEEEQSSLRGSDLDFPDLSPPKINYMELSKERTAIILCDLAQKTWHPSRMCEWCLEYDDEFVRSYEFKESTKVWLDDILVMDDFIPDDLMRLTADAAACGMPRLHKIPGALESIQHELRRRIPSLSVVGTCVTAGLYGVGEGMYTHVDGSLQGGTHSLVIYLNDVQSGGDIVFCESGSKIRTKKGRCVLFDVHMLHKVEPVLDGQKYIMACECIF